MKTFSDSYWEKRISEACEESILSHTKKLSENI